MASRLPLSQRLQGQAKKPVELLSFDNDPNGNLHFDDRNLGYFYLPRTDADRGNIDLSAGFNPLLFDPSVTEAKFIDKVLSAIIHYEKTNSKKIEAQIVCWRGLLTTLLLRSQQHVDRYACDNELVVEVVKFDNQIFLYERKPVNKPKPTPEMQKFTYVGYKFEEVATLKRPFGESKRNDIEGRYNLNSMPNLLDMHCVLIKSGVGGVDLVYGCEVDCVRQKRVSNELDKYIELKTSKKIESRQDAIKFERKLMRTWVQSFLSGVPTIVYGFHLNFKLIAVEEYKTQQIPTFQSKSQLTRPDQRWKGNDIIAFYNVLVHWLVDRCENNKTYILTSQPNSSEMKLQPTQIEHTNRKIAFLSNEFVEHRANVTFK